MCGIAGIINFTDQHPIQDDELIRMANAIQHRGPDDWGTYISPDKRCGLAHRRLSIIDLAGGHQPLSAQNENLWITYNGECYNFPQLRQQLQNQGHTFKTNSDTEALLHLYQEYGPACLDHIRGMFALAIWDNSKQELFLARDRLGQKPLYVAHHQGRFIFASECKAILQTNNFPRTVNTSTLTEFLLLNNIPAPNTAFQNIQQLPPATTLTINAKTIHTAQPKTYWSVPTEPTFSGSFDQASQAVRDTLTESTQLRMISDVPLGAFLSGGIDSTIIVGLMSQLDNQPVKTCSIGFDETLYNETDIARQTATLFNCDHTEYITAPNCIDTIKKLCIQYDDPFADSSALPTWHLSHLARSKVTVALTGDAGDECFGGYDRYNAMRLAQRVSTNPLLKWIANRKFWHTLKSGEYRSKTRKLQRFMAAAALPPQQRYLNWLAVFSPDLINSLIQNQSLPAPSPNILSPWFQYNGHDADITNAMLADAHIYLPGDLNTKTDRAAMSVGLELRCPFQDHKLVELAYSLPAHYRHNGKISKHILRHAFKDLIPDHVNHQPKRGFGVPLGQWFRNELKELFHDTVLSQRAMDRGYFSTETIHTMIHEHQTRQTDHGHRFWSLLMLELWHRQYIDCSII